MAENIILVTFDALRKTAVIPKTKLDYGQKLEFVNLELPEVFEADFCNSGDTETRTVLGQNGIVQIPDEYLQTGKNILCYLYLHYTPDSGQTQYTVQIPVTTRPDRTEETPTPVEQSLIEQAIAALNDGVERAEAAAELLENPAAEAETLAPGSDATAAYEDGVFRFGIPQGEKGDPFTYEDFTEEQKQELVDGPILDAQTAAVAAVGAAGTTQVGNVNAAGSTQVAAVNAAGTTQVQAVEDKGDEVLESIPQDYTQLSEDVDELKVGKAPVITDTANGAIASFPDGAKNLPLKKLVAQIDPVQDLHGYDSPWPAGGGVNKFDLAASFDEGETVTANGITAKYSNGYLKITGTNTSGTGFNIIYKQTTGTLTAGTYIMPAHVTVRASIDGGGNTNYASAMTANSGIDIIAFYVAVSASATDLNWNIPMLLVEGTTIPTTYSPYSNVCPISGWTGLEGKRTGKNLLSTKLYSGGSYNMNVGTVFSFSESTKQFTDEGNGVFSINTTVTWEGYTMLAPIGNATNVCFKTVLNSTGQDGFTAYLLDEGYAVLEKVIGNSVPVAALWPVNLANYPTAKYFAFFFTNRGTASTKLTVTEPQLELGSTASAYSQYQGESLSVSWQDTAGTVYGGNIVVNEDGSGVLTAIYADVDLTTGMSGGTAGSGYVFYKALTNAKVVPNSQIAPIIAEAYKPVRYNAIASSPYMIAIRDNGTVYVNTGSADIQPVGKAIYELATPLTYTFDNLTQLTTLLGTNNIWVDTGDVSVEYRADTKRYVDKKLAAIVAALS